MHSEDLLARALIGLARGLARLPRPVMRALAHPIAWFSYVAVPRRRKVALANLAVAFPKWTSARRAQVARAHFVEFVISLIDRFALWEGPVSRLEALVKASGWEHLEGALARGPVIVLAPHFLGMDAGGLLISARIPVVSVYAQQKSQYLTDAMTRGRARFPNTSLVLRNEGLRAVLRHMRKGKTLYLLPDMDLGARDAVFVPFFDVEAATVTTVSRLARMTGAQVVPTATRMVGDAYALEIYPAWEGFAQSDPHAAARAMNRFIEERIREMPSQYLWTHRRYKTRPDGAPPLYPGS